eukprot:gene5254-6081_t
MPSQSAPANSAVFLSKAINEAYHVVAKIGEGISGSVYKAIKRDTNEMVALKNFKTGPDTERASKEEYTLLMQLRHIPYITPILDIVTTPSEYNIVFPYFEHDLSGLLSEHRFSIPQVKCYFKQLLQAANILVNNKGSLFIGDLGTATSYVKRSVFSSKVVTLWYRAPELLLGSTMYGPEVDMWSIGMNINGRRTDEHLTSARWGANGGQLWTTCVLIELVTSRNFLPGNTEAQQIEAICKLCGTPSEAIWSGVSALPNYSMIAQVPLHPSRLRSVFKNFSLDFVELLEGLLTLNPKKRLTAAQALQSPFFTNEPLPFELEKMPGYQPIHVLEAIQKRMIQQQQPQQQPTQSQQQQPTRPTQPQPQQPIKPTPVTISKPSAPKVVTPAPSRPSTQVLPIQSTKPTQQPTPLPTNTNKPVISQSTTTAQIDDIRNYCTSDSDESEYELECEESDFYSEEEDEDFSDDDSEIEYYTTRFIPPQVAAMATSVKTSTTPTNNYPNFYLLGQPNRRPNPLSERAPTIHGSQSNDLAIPDTT